MKNSAVAEFIKELGEEIQKNNWCDKEWLESQRFLYFT